MKKYAVVCLHCQSVASELFRIAHGIRAIIFAAELGHTAGRADTAERRSVRRQTQTLETGPACKDRRLV